MKLKAGAVESVEKSGVELEFNLDVAEDENWGEDDHLGDSKKSAEKVSDNILINSIYTKLNSIIRNI